MLIVPPVNKIYFGVSCAADGCIIIFYFYLSSSFFALQHLVLDDF
jgi:hypothetical protein